MAGKCFYYPKSIAKEVKMRYTYKQSLYFVIEK
jgi:hypothetical protein